MESKVIDFFKSKNIEYYYEIPIDKCKIINEELLKRTIPDAKSVLVFLVPYYVMVPKQHNISIYAAAKDYHLFFKELFVPLEKLLKECYPTFNFKGMSDHSPIDEVDAAAKCGLGVIGDNNMLINPEYGSYVFIAEIISDKPCNNDIYKVGFCTHCGNCKNACPSPDNCLSALTQKKGELNEAESALIHKNKTIWGCDKCQDVCPFNENIKISPIEFFHRDLIFNLTKDELDSMSDEEFNTRAYSWRKRKTIERNINILNQE